MKYCVCTDAVFMDKGNFTYAMEQVKKAGYDAVEFWSWWDKDMAVFAKTAKDLDLKVATFCTEFIDTGDISLQADYLEALKHSIEIAKKLDCPSIIAQAGWEFDTFKKEITRKEHRKALIETMQKSAVLAEDAGITLVIEPLNNKVNHPGYHLSTSEDAFDLVDRIGSPNVKILFDIYHQQITEGNLLMNIMENLGKIGHFHAAGNPGRGEITKGEIHYRHIFEEIAKTNYDGYIGLEYMVDCDPVPGLVEAREKILVF